MKATIVAYALLMQCFENATIVAYVGLRVKSGCQTVVFQNIIRHSSEFSEG